MPGFGNPQLDQATALNASAARLFAQGSDARGTANLFVRDTVLLAVVLLPVAIAQRFRVRGVRLAANAVAFTLLAYTIFEVSTLPRIR